MGGTCLSTIIVVLIFSGPSVVGRWNLGCADFSHIPHLPTTPYSNVFFEALLANKPYARQNILAELIRIAPTLNSLGFGGLGLVMRLLYILVLQAPKPLWSD
jgi:hypothetical protein